MSSVILDTGPCLNFFAVGQGNLMHRALDVDFDRVLVPREVANEIEDKSGEDGRFARARSMFGGMSRQGLFEILESEESDEELFTAIKIVSSRPPSELMVRRTKNLGETMVIAHAIKLRRQGHTVTVVIDDGGGRRMAAKNGFEPIGTVRILGLAARNGLVTRAENKALYERLRPSAGAPALDDGLPHWSLTGLDKKELYRR